MSDKKAAEASECGPLRSSSASARPESTDRCVPMGRNDAGRGEEGSGCGIPQRATSNGWSKALRDDGWQISLTKKGMEGRGMKEKRRGREASRL